MNAIKNWDKVKASGDFERLVPGGYICEIKAVSDNSDKQYLKISYDITEGNFAGYWGNYEERSGNWRGNFYRSYKESAAGMFKGFINAVEASNEGFSWNWKEQELVGKKIGLVIGDEEYIANDGSVGTWPKVRTVKSVEAIRNGKFRIPETTKVDAEIPSVPDTISTDDMPF